MYLGRSESSSLTVPIQRQTLPYPNSGTLIGSAIVSAIVRKLAAPRGADLRRPRGHRGP